MQVKVISDTHNRHDELQDLECDLLIHCGDACTRGNYTEVEKFLQWFVKQPAKYKVYVPGNHDKAFKKNKLLPMLAHEYGIHYLRNDGVTINGVTIWGGDLVPWFRDEKCMTPTEVKHNAWKDMPDTMDILVTHCPPMYILDLTARNQHIGCDVLSECVKQKDIKYHVFGHVHETGGQTMEVFDTKFINASCTNLQYLKVRDAYEFTIDK